ncbi:hypothetical protein [Aeromonas veronii]
MRNEVSIIDFLAGIGSENIKFQLLSQCMLNAKQKKRDTEVTFATDIIRRVGDSTNNGVDALILWVDGELMHRSLEEAKIGCIAINSRAIMLESIIATFEREGSGTREIDGQRYVSIDHLKDMASAIRHLKSSGGAI